MPDRAKQHAAREAVVALVDRMRDDSLDAVLAVRQVPNAKLVLSVPRSDNRPVEAVIVGGGLQLSLFETREIA